ncbi:hypothetical protein VMCG_08232 [Cytospora schulzeri]|uniref:Uncharacterized protein n=1 Tax=Cytospora schulzeri TaxID=448051 RepID=A0A423VSS8_9PEZI|nr:hypothetical protein VMCG_08232 [Valsa malicola]
MAQEVRPIGYLDEGTMDSRLVFPDYRDIAIQDVEWMVLKQNPRDPVCLVDLTIIHMSPLGRQRGGLSFSSITAQTCGIPWYWSNVYRSGPGGYVNQIPCFWLGRGEVNVLQLHMPTHTRPRQAVGANATHEDLWDYFCNRPAILSWHKEMPPRVVDVLEQDLRKRGDKTYASDYLERVGDDSERSADQGEVYKPPTWGGGGDGRKQRLAKRSSTASPLSVQEGLTVEYMVAERSARTLCSSKSSMGPDYVNVPEGLFCRMSDKTLFPLCDFSNAEGLREDCFDVGSQDLVPEGQQLQKRSQYALVRHRGRDRPEEELEEIH